MKIFDFFFKTLIFSAFLFIASSFVGINKTSSGFEFELFKLNPESEAESDQPASYEDVLPEFTRQKSKWVDSVFNSLTIDEKIGQLFMVAAYSNMGVEHKKSIENIINKYKIGGLIFFQGSPVKQAQLTNHYQAISKTPLLIAMDAEWGLAMRLDSTTYFPRQMMMGAVQDDQIIYEFGNEVGRQCNRLGVHVNFAPVIDINNNPRNPVINSRSFGEQRMNVANKGFAYMFGMQEKNVIATAKHFPGHGDTESDSHHTLPVISHSINRLDSVELFPFKYLIDNGLAGMMVAHLHIPALDSSSNIASSLSYKIVSQKLKETMKFKGLVFTDALGMKGVSNYNAPGEVTLKAFMAGTDVLLMPANVEASVLAIKSALNSGLISEKEINDKCYKILQAKKWVGLDNFKPISTKGLIDDLNSSETRFVKQRIIESAITLVENKNNLIPLKNIGKIKVASVAIGSGDYTTFQKSLSLYDDVKHFSINKAADINEFKSLIGKLVNFDVVIVGFLKSNHSPSAFGLTSPSLWFAHELSAYTKVIVDVFASPYALSKFDKEKFQTIIMSYEDDELCQDLSAQLIYGGIPAKGKLPVSAGNNYPAKTGLTDEKIRLKYAEPKELKINDINLKKIDTIVISAIEQGAIPGCQILAAKNGIVFFNKAYGYHTYEKKKAVQTTDLYDLASVTKISATLPTLMRLYDEGKINVDDKLSKYIPELDSTDKKNITIKQVLAHQARLIAWIPFYLKPFRSDLEKDFFRSVSDSIFNIEVAENLYMNKFYVDSIFQRIYKSPLRKKVKYLYSDLGFYLFYKMLSEKMNINFQNYLDSVFYNNLGVNTLGFNPLQRFDKERIVPTENDKKYRKQLVQGYVHDYGAAMMGGVAGHAGLFSNANDLAKLMQMYLQMGEYGGDRFISASTIELFTSNAYSKSKNRRALGFDKPGLAKKSPVSKLASPDSFGHTGFTGTIAWVDPKEQFVYIFLSNRVHPDAENNKLNKLEVRTRVHEVFYRSFK